MNVDVIRRSVLATAAFGMASGSVVAQESKDSAAEAAEVSTAVVAAAEPVEVTPAKKWLTGGGDIRVRQVQFDDIPIVADPPGVTRGGMNKFFRFRTRLWAKADAGEYLSFYGRLTHEVRYYANPTNDTWEWPDEVVVDSLYMDIKNVPDWAFRLGRQDFAGPVTGYGTGKLILDGTPKDGSRTIYFDAVKAQYLGIDNVSIDLVGIYNQPENDLVISSEDRDLTGYTAGYNDMTESGGFVYLKDSRYANTPYEAYYVYKRESSWMKGDVDMPSGYFNTFGGRVMPTLGDDFSANVELAYQFGERSGGQEQDGWLLDAALAYAIPAMEGHAPTLTAGYYYLSGNDPDTTDDEGWNPLWARWPQYSELYVYAFDAEGAGRWSNVMFAHLDYSMILSQWARLKAYVGPMYADQKNGPGGGSERGWLGVIRSDFTIFKGWPHGAGRLTGHLLAEVFKPGDYYNVEDTAHFLRWELTYAF